MKETIKLYKSGKIWKTVALTVATVVGVLATTTLIGQADTNNQGATPVNNSTQVATDNTSNEANSQPLESNSNNSVKTGWQQAADKSWTYYNNDGKANTGREYSLMPTIGDTTGKSKSWYLMQDGKALSGVQEWAGSYWDFDKTSYTLSQKKDYFQSQWGLWYLKDDTGRIQSGVQEWAGSYWYFDPTTYLVSQKKDYFQSQWGLWYLKDDTGRIQSGVQEWMGSYWYFDPTTYLLTKKQDYVQSQWGDWYMVGNDGRIQSGLVNWMGNTYYFDPVTYLRTDNKDFTVNGISYHADGSGVVSLNQYWFAPSENKPYPNVNDVNRITVNIRGNRVRLYNGNKLLYTMNCTAGKYVNGRSLTPTGTFYIQPERGNQFMNHTVGMGANYYTSWLNHGEYLFHSVVIDEKGNYIPSEAAKLGKTQGSHGCIRLSVPDAKYMMGMRVGTKVEIFG